MVIRIGADSVGKFGFVNVRAESLQERWDIDESWSFMAGELARRGYRVTKRSDTDLERLLVVSKEQPTGESAKEVEPQQPLEKAEPAHLPFVRLQWTDTELADLWAIMDDWMEQGGDSDNDNVA